MKSKIESGKPDRELSREEKQIARSLENLKISDIKEKIFLILVWRKLKSASQLYFKLNTTDAEIEKIKNEIENAGLFFADSGINQKKKSRICFVANNQKNLDLISKVWFGDHFKDPKVYKEIGRMSSFPQSAIDTYDQFTQLPEPTRENKRQELTLSPEGKKNLFPPDIYPFSLFFFISKAHWQRELETVRKWAEEIKLVTPDLYRAFVANPKGLKNNSKS